MKSVLISTQPKWCEKICRKIGEENGIPIYLKPVEVRKSAPKEVPFRAYLYCTNGRFDITDIDDLTSESVRVVSEGRGKVIGEFVCDRVERLPAFFERTDGTCLTVKELDKYGSNRKGELFYWHISDLKIYDKPRDLGEFKNLKGEQIKRPFQSWGYIND